MEYVKLGDIAKIVAGSTAPKENQFNDNIGLPFIRAGHLEDLCNNYDLRKLPKIDENNKNIKKQVKVPKNTIVFAKSGMSCMKSRVYQTTEECYIVNHLAGVICSENVNPSYLKYYFMVNKPNRLIVDESYPSIRLSDISNMDIYLPNLDTQQKIAEVLDKAQELIDKRKEQIEVLDELVKSRFIEMFGDPVSNPKGWEKGKIADIIIKTQYGTSNKANEENGQFKILRMGNITYNGQFDFSDMKYIDLTEDEQKKYLVYKGEVLFNRTNSKELVGKTAVYKENKPMAYAGYLVKAIPNERATGEFIAAYMNTKYVKSKLLNMAKNIVGMANINAEEFKKIDIYIPPIELQNEYIKFIEQVDKLKFEMEKSLKELEDNFNSLMEKAFNEELLK